MHWALLARTCLTSNNSTPKCGDKEQNLLIAIKDAFCKEQSIRGSSRSTTATINPIGL
jgi:hypothetical protein